MQGYDGAIQAWIANLISRRVAPSFGFSQVEPFHMTLIK